jgi:hypothetical protein
MMLSKCMVLLENAPKEFHIPGNCSPSLGLGQDPELLGYVFKILARTIDV